MEINELFGLPAHPLLVHAAVVLLPLAALATIVVAVVPKTRRHYAPVALVLAIAALGAVGLAQGSGEEFEEEVTETELVEEHTEQGESVLPWAIALVVVAAGVTAVDPLADRYPDANLTGRTVSVVLVIVTLVVAVGATWAVIDVGHSGAKATWDESALAAHPEQYRRSMQ
jgi:uncharacterized membrane protein